MIIGFESIKIVYTISRELIRYHIYYHITTQTIIIIPYYNQSIYSSHHISAYNLYSDEYTPTPVYSMLFRAIRNSANKSKGIINHMSKDSSLYNVFIILIINLNLLIL